MAERLAPTGAALPGMGVASEYLTAPGRFAYLLEALHRQTGQTVVVLVDEYDKPIVDTLSTPEIALANRDYLRGMIIFVGAGRCRSRIERFERPGGTSGLVRWVTVTKWHAQGGGLWVSGW